MGAQFRIPLFDLAACVSDALDLVDPAVVAHHLQVACIAQALGAELGLAVDEQTELAIAGALHDVGAFSNAERIDTLRFEDSRVGPHARVGSRLLEPFEPFRRIAAFVKYHHMPWADGRGAANSDEEIPAQAHLLHLADRIAVSLEPGRPVLWQTESVVERIEARAGTTFAPDHVAAFKALAGREHFWFDAVSPSIGALLRRRLNAPPFEMDAAGVLSLARLFRRIIDFKSRFTATHCSGVSAVAERLAQVAGFSDDDRMLVLIASHLHDIGKLAIPQEILEKRGRLTSHEYAVMKSHAYHSYRILEPIEDLDTVRRWGALHQERINGTGYPFHLEGAELPEGARLIAVADVFTALTEDRPYRAGMARADVLGLLDRMTAAGELDGDVVALARAHYDEVDGRRAAAQTESARDYEGFRTAKDQMDD